MQAALSLPCSLWLSTTTEPRTARGSGAKARFVEDAAVARGEV